MEPLRPIAMSATNALRSRLSLLRSGISAITLVSLMCGCVTMPVTGWTSFVAAKPPVQINAVWKPEVIFTPDPAHNGEPSPGFAGRVYLFDESIKYPVLGDGKLIAEMFLEDGQPMANKKPVERWELDRETLKRLQKRDAFGWGYTVFLPWGTYRPDIKQVRLRLKYEPSNGGYPLFSESDLLTLSSHTVRGFGEAKTETKMVPIGQAMPSAK